MEGNKVICTFDGEAWKFEIRGNQLIDPESYIEEYCEVGIWIEERR